ncbi:hypothetical protein PVK06_027083 [Gossypium arboreum]|uniref:Aminotransferase-like plant mobile domain-containing protein n=1 Tax=Gossypium arboreum TaxID=29729 RepID=A0ABR0P1X1_GOSAR|nr:hypothetical protein PVK06_027083 [Gossypium arboreum]
MADDRVLKAFIHNTGEPLIPEICGYLQEVGFLQASPMQRGFKLDLTLISSLVERWRPETHTFHLSCGKCTITLKDVALQLGLLVDEPVIAGSAVILGKVELFTTVQRWLDIDQLVGKNFDKLPDDATKKAWWQIPFLRLRVTDPYMFLLVMRWNHGPSYVELPDELEDVRLLLDQ